MIHAMAAVAATRRSTRPPARRKPRGGRRVPAPTRPAPERTSTW